MAEFNANINVNAKVNKALDAVSKLERRIAKIEDITVKLNVEGRQEFKRIGDSFKRLAAIIKTSGVVTAVAAVTGSLQSLNNLPVIGGGLNTTALGKVVSQLGAFSNAAVDAAASAPGLAAGIAASTAALIAFAPQLSRATKDTLKLARVAAEAKAPLQNVLNLIGAASSSGTLGGFGDAAAGVEEFRRRLFELNESVSNLQKRANSLKTALDGFNSGSATAEKIAEKLVDVNARLNEELREQADLLRRVAGVNVTELEASKGRNSIETKKRRESFLKEQAQEANAVTQSLQKLEEAEAKLNNERLDARAEQEQIRLEQKLRAENDESIRSIRRRNQIEERVANARSARIARATQFARNLEDRFGQAPRALPSTEILNPEGRGIKRISSIYGDLNTQIDKGVQNAKEFTQELNTQAAKAQTLPPIFNQVARALEATQQATKKAEFLVGDPKATKDPAGPLQARTVALRKLAALEQKLIAETAALRERKDLKSFNTRQRRIKFLAQKEKAAQKAREDRRESLALGVGFPLLFGGGIGSIAGGAAGSFVGKGFGGQILLSAVGQQLDALVARILTDLASIGAALDKPSEGLDALEAAGIKVADSSRELIEELEAAGKVYDAQTVLFAEINSRLGSDGVNKLNAFDQAVEELQQETSELTGELLTQLLPAATAATRLVTSFAGALNEIVNVLTNPNIGDFLLGNALGRLIPGNVVPPGFLGRGARALADASGITGTEPDRSELQGQQSKVERISKNNLELSELQRDAISASNDLLDDTVFKEKQAAIIRRAQLREQNLVLSGKGTEVKVNEILADRDRELLSLTEQRTKAQDALTRKRERESKAAAREAEAAARAEQQVQRTLAAQQTRDFNLDTQFQTLGATPLDSANIELQRLAQLKTLKENQIILSGEDARIQAAKLANLDKEFFIESEKLKLRQQTLQIEKQIQAIQNRQENEGLRRELTQELNSFQLPTGNPFEDEKLNLRREQENRQANILQGLKDQLEIQEKLATNQNEAISVPAAAEVEKLKALETTYKELLPQIFAAEQAQLKFNQALSLVQGPVDAFVGGLVSGLQDVIAGTKSAEEAFADFLSGIANALIQTASTLIAQYIAIGIARKFAGLSPASTGTSPGDFNLNGFGNLTGPTPGFADGGRPPVGETSIVGERGPELFVPDRPGTIVPNEFFDAARQALQPSGGNISDRSDTSEAFAAATAALERNTTNIVNRQSTVSQETSFNNFAESLRSEQRQPIRFETVRVGEIDMVTKEEALKIGADSAKAAEANVFSALKNKPSVRRSIGMS